MKEPTHYLDELECRTKLGYDNQIGMNGITIKLNMLNKIFFMESLFNLDKEN